MADMKLIERHRDNNENIVEEAITGKNMFKNRLSFFNDIVNPSRATSTISPSSVKEESPPKLDEEELGLFRRSGSVRDMARKFGSNSSLSQNSNSNNSSPIRRSASLRIRTGRFMPKPIPVKTTPAPSSQLKEVQSVPVSAPGGTGEHNRAVIAKHRQAGFLSTEPLPVVTSLRRKSMKLQQLEAKYGENIQSPLPNKNILLPSPIASLPMQTPKPSTPTPKSTSSQSEPKEVAPKMRKARPRSAIPDFSFSIDSGSPLTARKSFVEKLATSSSNQSENRLTVTSRVDRDLPSIDVDELDAIITGGGSVNDCAFGGVVELDNDLGGSRRAPLLPRASRPRPRSRSRRRCSNPLKSGPTGESSYTETQTDLGFKMCQGDPMKKLASCATAALQAKEDVTKVRLRNSSRQRDDVMLPYKHPMLIRFKGRRQVAVELISPRAKRLSHSDSFLLVTAERVFSFLPQNSNVIEKNRARDFGQAITRTGQLGTRAKVVEDGRDNPAFWAILGSKSRLPKSSEVTPDESDSSHESLYSADFRCWKLHEVGNRFDLKPEEAAWSTRPVQNILGEADFFVFEFGPEVYVWVGPKVSFAARRAGDLLAKQIWAKYDRKKWHLFGKVTSHRETALFTEKFSNWLRADQQNIITPKGRSRVGSQPKPALDPKEVALIDLDQEQRGVFVKNGRFNVAGGDGEIIEDDGRILRVKTIAYSAKTIQNGVLVERDLRTNATLLDTDVLILIWTFSITGIGRWKGITKSKTNLGDSEGHGGAARQVTFLWSGAAAGDHQRGKLALLANELKLGVTVNVVGGFEPEVFVKAWGGRLRFLTNQNQSCPKRPRLFLVGGETSTGCYLQQLDIVRPDLIPSQTYLVELPDKKLFQLVGREAIGATFVDELLNSGYSTSNDLVNDLIQPIYRSPVQEQILQMWSITSINGRFTATKAESRRIGKLRPFDQVQLRTISILLSSKSIYIWRKQRTSVDNAVFYDKLYQAARLIAAKVDKEKTVVDVFAGSESSNFRLLFPVWVCPSEDFTV